MERQGIEVAVGGGVTQRIAEAIGLKFFEIRTSDEDIAATLDNAASVALAGREQKAMARRYHSIIDSAVELGKQCARTDSTILDALQQTRYRMSRTAEHLGISRTTLWRKMKELGLG